jgi:hypothetical protein
MNQIPYKTDTDEITESLLQKQMFEKCDETADLQIDNVGHKAEYLLCFIELTTDLPDFVGRNIYCH